MHFGLDAVVCVLKGGGGGGIKGQAFNNIGLIALLIIFNYHVTVYSGGP